MRFLLLLAAVLPALNGADHPSLHAAAGEAFAIGMTASPDDLADPAIAALITQHAGTVSIENHLKMNHLHPAADRWGWERADDAVDRIRALGKDVVGHVLVWHPHAPDHVFAGDNGRPAPQDVVRKRLEAYIRTVTAHFAGRVRIWDVVNEALDDTDRGIGPFGLRDTPWLRALGPDYVADAFRMARAALPDGHLIYNDYNIEFGGKGRRAVAFLKDLKKQGVPIDAVGIQGHWTLDHPPLDLIDSGIAAIAALGYPIEITELDVNVLGGRASADVAAAADGPRGDPFKNGLTEAAQTLLAKRYAGIFRVLRKHQAAITRVTFWGTHDGRSWLNTWKKLGGKTNHPLLFDRQLQPKPAFFAVIDALRAP
jgi:endo-1,4-beta-xylanase